MKEYRVTIKTSVEAENWTEAMEEMKEQFKHIDAEITVEEAE